MKIECSHWPASLSLLSPQLRVSEAGSTFSANSISVPASLQWPCYQVYSKYLGHERPPSGLAFLSFRPGLETTEFSDIGGSTCISVKHLKWLVHNAMGIVRGHFIKKRGKYSVLDIWTVFFSPSVLPDTIESLLLDNKQENVICHSLPLKEAHWKKKKNEWDKSSPT